MARPFVNSAVPETSACVGDEDVGTTDPESFDLVEIRRFELHHR